MGDRKIGGWERRREPLLPEGIWAQMTKQELDRRRREQRRRRRQRQRRRQALRLAGTALLLCVMLTAGCAVLLHATGVGAVEQTDTEEQTEAGEESAAPAEENAAPAEENASQTGSEETEGQTYPEPDPNSVIYLTFDDGPSSTVTGEILDILEENCVQATFFIVDYSEDKIPLLERMIEDGETIGIHALEHDYEKCYSSEDAYLDGVEELKEKLYQDTGYEAFCLRFPGGSSNTISATTTRVL